MNAPAAAALEPIRPSERISSLDVLRGFALWGILWVNIQDYVHPPQGRIDKGLWLLMDFFARGNFYPLFSFLFGMGFAIQLRRADAKGGSFVAFFIRRMAALFLIGAALNVLLENRDILMRYAVFGVPLLFFRRVPQKWLPAAALACILAAAVAPDVQHAWRQSRPDDLADAPTVDEAEQERAVARRAEARRLAADGDYAGLVAHRWTHLTERVPPAFIRFTELNLLGIFLLGLYAVRRRLLEDPPAGFLGRAFGWCLAVGVAGGILETEKGRFFPGFLPLSETLPVRGLIAVGAVALSLSYAAAIVGLLRTPLGKRYGILLGPFGRMALTNYILESVFLTTIAYGYGLGQIGKLGQLAALVLSLVFVVIQVPVSTWWLKRFRFGPAEWLWRSMTYGRVQPFRMGILASSRQTPAV